MQEGFRAISLAPSARCISSGQLVPPQAAANLSEGGALEAGWAGWAVWAVWVVWVGGGLDEYGA